MRSYNPASMTSRTYHIPMFARELEVKFSDGVLGLDLGGMKRQIRLLPSSISHGPIEPGQTTIDWETGQPQGGDCVRSRQYKTERDQLNEDFSGAVIGAIESAVVGVVRWLETET